ncbi:MAG: hypothetical protein KatS3mg108_3124 [Isosphaeraceae bacterium]|jgi:hypothetical protein|nr:MAG: hypothetical protein KatS3mg108_3124 [Isosphaeraceae bacterium]
MSRPALLRLALTAAWFAAVNPASHPGELPPIRRLRIPSQEIVRLFGADTPVRSLNLADLERYLDTVRRSLNDPMPHPPRLIRAEHQARWMDGDVLEGRSTLTVEIGPDPPAAVPLVPWNLPITPSAGLPDLRTRPDGRLIAWITQPGVSTIVIPWQLPVRLDADSADLSLELPDCALSALTIDLPDRLDFDTSTPNRIRHLLAEPGRTLLRIDGASGRIVATIRRRDGIAPPPDPPWLSARHQFEITADGPRFEAEWDLRLPTPPPRSLITVWESPLEATTILGPGVDGFEVLPGTGPETQVLIRLAEGAAPRQTLHLEGRVRPPTSGRWKIPRVRLPGSLLLGERTLVHLGPEWIVLNTRRIAAERVPVPPDSLARGGSWLAFDATADGPPAELELGEPDLSPRVDLRAALRLESDRAYLDAEATWNFPGPRPPTLSIALPTEWTWDSVQIVSLDEPTLWSSAFEPDVGHVATVIPPQARDPATPVIVRFRAFRSLISTSRLAVPRPQPRPGYTSDELWSLIADDRISIRPLSAQSVEWLDPLRTRTDGFDDTPRFAWRWRDRHARLDFDLTPTRLRPTAISRLLVCPAGDSFDLDAYLSIDLPPSELDRLVIEHSADVAWSWALVREGVDQPLPVLAVHTVPPAEPGSAPRLAQTLKLPARRWESGRILLHAHSQLGPDGGPLPTFALNGDQHPDQRLLVAASEQFGFELSGVGLSRLDPRLEFDSAHQTIPALDLDPRSLRSNRIAYRVSGRGPEPRLRITQREQLSTPGLIALAEWTPGPPTESGRTCRLVAEFTCPSYPDLKARLPDGARPVAAWLDAVAFDPTTSDGWLAIPRGIGPGRSAHRLELVYQEPPGLDPAAPRFPRLSLPVLNTIVRASDRIAVSPGAALARSSTPAPGRTIRPSSTFQADLELPAPGSTLIAWLESQARRGITWIIDSEALATAAARPESPFPQNSDASVSRALEALGLTVVPLEAALLLTTPSAAARLDRPARILEAARDGQDPSHRFLTLWRWRTNPPPPASDRVLPPHLIPDGAQVRLESRTQTGWRTEAWFVAALVLALGWPSRRQPTLASRLLVLGYALLAGLILVLPQLAPWIAPSVVAGVVIAAARWLRPVEPVNLPPNAAASTATLRGASTLLLAYAFHALVASATAGQRVPDESAPEPILILLPFDTAEDAAAPPARAVVRLADLERLERLVRETEQQRARQQRERSDGFGAREARHSLQQSDDQLLLRSTYQVVGADPEGSLWPIPLDGWLGVTVWVDDQEAPITLDPDLGVGRVRIRGPGSHELRVEATGLAQTSVHPRIVPVALAIRESTVDSVGPAPQPIGPVDRLDLDLATDPPASRPVLDLQTLWEAGPLGDLLELRLQNAGTEPLDTLSLQLPTRDARILPIPIEGRRDRVHPDSPPSNPDRWSIALMPALAPGEETRLLAWRPAAQGLRSPRSLPPPVISGDAEIRTHAVAVRPRAGWSLQPSDPLIGGDARLPISEFLAAWGEPIPADQRPTAAWDARDSNPLSLLVRTSVSPTHLRPRLDCTIDGQRVRVQAEVEIVAADPSLPALSVQLPHRLRLIDVSGEGVLSWHLSGDSHQLVLHWDSQRGPPQRLAILGWLDSDGPAAPLEGLSRELVLSIPRWQAEIVEPTELRLAAAPEVALDLEEPSGWSRSIPASGSSGPVPVRAAFRVEPNAADAHLRYRLEGPAADVRVLSHLEFQPDSIEWRASARYRVRGGPYRELRLDLPAAFAAQLDVQVEPSPSEIRRLPMGDTTRLEVRFETPTWDEPRVIVRSVTPTQPGPVEFPNLVPLGLGRVESYLAWFDASGRRYAAEGSAGVREVERARFPSSELNLEERPTRRVYRILRSDWSLRLRPGRPDPEPDVPHITHALIQLQAGLDGRIAGRLLCHLASPPGHSLNFRFPASAQILGAHDGLRFLPCYRTRSGRLLVPPGSTRVVAVYWVTPATPGSIGIELPVPDQPGVPLHVELRDPIASRTVPTEADGLAPAERATLLVETIELEARTLEARLPTLDRSDPDALADLAAAIEQLDHLRGELADAAAASTPVPTTTRLALADAARARLQSALRDAGLSLPPPGTAQTPSESDALPPRLPLFGTPSWFRGISAAEPPRLILAARSATRPQPTWDAPRSSFASLLVAIALAASRTGRLARSAAVIATLTALTLLVWPA